jgi:hypothetical protein
MAVRSGLPIPSGPNSVGANRILGVPIYRALKLIIKNRKKPSEFANHSPSSDNSLIKLGFRQRPAHAHAAREGCPLPAAMHDGADPPFSKNKHPNKRPNKRPMGDT